MEKELPKNWVDVSLQDVTKNVKGKKPKIQLETEFEGSIPYMDIKALEYNEIRQFADVESSKLFEEGDVAMVWDGARSGWVSKTNFGAIGSTLVAFKPIKINSNYLFYYLLEKYPYINSNARGVGIPHVDPTVLWSLKFPLPPLTEQNRIVAKLDSLFAQLERIKTSMAKIPVLLKNFRQQILTQAVTGKLTEEWRVGKDLFSEKLLCSIKENRKILINKRDDKSDVFINNEILDIPDNWIQVNLWDLAFLVTSGSRDWSQYYSDEGAYFVRSAEINNNKLRLEEAIRVNLPEKIEGKRSLIEKGNILITITGANVGKCALIEESIPEAYVSQSVALVKIVDTKISKFIHLSLLSRSNGGSQLENLAYGMGRPVLSLPQIKSVKIPLPSLEEQQEIVSLLESLFAKADAIEEKYKNLKAKLEVLPQTILHKAFKGELTEQLDTDGDAKVLLEEIAALKSEGRTRKAIPKKYVQTDDEVLRIVAEEMPSIQVLSPRDKKVQRKMLATHIINQSLKDQSFGKTKFEKLLHLVECHVLQTDLNQNYSVQAAGPYDGGFTKTFWDEVLKSKWFAIEEQGNLRRIVGGENNDKSLKDYGYFSEEQKEKISQLIEVFKSSNYEQPEIISTLYAVWNNRLLRKEIITDDLLKEDFLNWDSGKAKYAARLDKALEWMREKGIVPSGWGKEIKRVKKK